MRKVLIIDDNIVIRQGMEDLLEPLEVGCIQAINGIDGIQKALRHHPDVITMDVEMPHLNGFCTARILTLLQLKIPIIFISSREGLEGYTKHYPSVIDHCSKSDLREKLVSLVTKAFQIEPKEFTDLSYTLRQKEALDLYSLSQRKKILILEDSRMMMSVILDNLDQTELFELYHAKNGQEGLFKAIMIKPDLILTDIEMPIIDGITMVQTLFILGYPFPVAFVTNKNDIDTVKRVMKLDGVRGFLIKQEVLQDAQLFKRKVEELMDIPSEQKEALQQNYQKIDLDKLCASGDKRGVFNAQYNPDKKQQPRRRR